MMTVSSPVLGERPSSQMSFLDQFLKVSSVSRHTTPGETFPSLFFLTSSFCTGREPGPLAQHQRGFSLESDEGDVEDNRAASLASSRSNMSEQSADAASPMVAGGNPRISAPLQNTSLGSGAGLQGLQGNSKPKCHQFLIRYKPPKAPSHLSSFVLPITRKLVMTLLAFNLIAGNLFHQL